MLRAVDGETGLKADLSTVGEGLDEFAISARRASCFVLSQPTAALYDAKY
jgi:hypothetical protein